MPITHAKVSGIADGPDTAQVRPSDWNAAHVGGELVGPPTAIALVSDAFDATGLHYVLLDIESGVSDDLLGITGGVDGQVLVIEFAGAGGEFILIGESATTDRTFDANSTTLDEIADVLGTLIADLRARKLVT